MDQHTRSLIEAIIAPVASDDEGQELSARLRGGDDDYFFEVRQHYWIEYVARRLAADSKARVITSAHREQASSILNRPNPEGVDKKLYDGARQYWRRFRRDHKIPDREALGGARDPWFAPSWRNRELLKAVRDIVDCPNRRKREEMAKEHLSQQLGRLLGFLDALEKRTRSASAFGYLRSDLEAILNEVELFRPEDR